MFWRSVQAGVLAAGRDFDVEIQWNGPTKETDFSRQIQIVESMINGRVDGIVLSPTERIALVDCRRVTLSMERASIQYALSKRTVRVEPTATR